MADELRRQFMLPEIPEGIDPKLDEYLRQINEIIKELSVISTTWDGLDSDTAKLGFVDRGDPSSHDWTQATLTLDGTWNDLDCSAIVPENVKAILFYVALDDNLVSSNFSLRKNGNSNTVVRGLIRVTVASQASYSQKVVACDDGRFVEYNGTSGIDQLDLTVAGWWLNG